MPRETQLLITRQGDVELPSATGYMVVGNDDAVCFHLDTRGRAYVSAFTSDENDYPVIYLAKGEVSDDECRESIDTEVTFPEFKGWSFHAGGSGKTIAIALVRRGAGE